MEIWWKKGDLTRDEARHHPRRNLITRALGTDPAWRRMPSPEMEAGGLPAAVLRRADEHRDRSGAYLFEVIHSEPLDTCLGGCWPSPRQRGRRITSLLCC